MKSLLVRLEVIFIGLSFFGSVEVWGADWKFFSSNDLYDVFYYVSDSQPLYKGTVRVWVKLEYTEKGIAEHIKRSGKKYENLSYSLQYWEISCPAKRQYTLSVNHYSAQGSILNTKPAKSPFSKVFTYSLVEEICK